MKAPPSRSEVCLHPPHDPYSQPVLYDLEYQHHREDIATYVQLASRLRGPVVELACGNGRVTLPIAREGIPIHGIDLSPTMLQSLEGKLQLEPPEVRMIVTTELGDYRDFHLKGQVPLVLLPFNAIHHCEGRGDIDRLFASVDRALLKGGLFAFDCYLPDPELYGRDPEGRYEERDFIDPRDGKRLRSWETSWWEADRRIHHVKYTYQHMDGTEEQTHLALHMFEREEMLQWIAEAGFELMAEGSDFRGTPVKENSLKWVLILRKSDGL